MPTTPQSSSREGSTLKLVFPRPHSGQMKIIQEAKRFNVLCCGARFGKTTLGIDRIATPAVHGFPTAWFAPTYKLLAEAWREVISDNWLGPVLKKVNTDEHRLELVGGGSVDFWTLEDASENTARGRKYKVAVVDEASGVKNLVAIWQSLIRTRLTDYQGDAWFLSTPRGYNGFKVLFDYGLDPQKPDWMSWHMPTVMNPHMRPSEIEEARKDLTEDRFRQEYLGDFVNWEGSVFRNIRECISDTCLRKGPEEGHKYVIGGDWGKKDFTVFIVLDTTTRNVVFMDRSNKVNYALQRDRLKHLRNIWKPQSILVEHNSIGDPIIEELLKDGVQVIPFDTSNASKSVIVEALSLALEQQRITIPNDPTLISELEAYTGSALPSGLIRYSAPEGQNDDIVMALMLAWNIGFSGIKLLGLTELVQSLKSSGGGENVNAIFSADVVKETESMNKLQRSNSMKVVTNPKTVGCEVCQSLCLTRIGTQTRCNQCGHMSGEPVTADIMNRKEYLLKVS